MALTDFETSIKLYLVNKLAEYFPELSADSGSQVADLTVNPQIEIMKPIMDLVNRIDFVHNLANAEFMTAEELDEIGINNYGISRAAGDKASGYLYVEMEPEYVGPEMVIIGVVTAATAGGLRFTSSSPTIIRYSASEEVRVPGTVAQGIASDYFNVSSGKYEFPIFVEAEVEGTAYNVSANTITVLVTNYPLLTGTVFNKESFTNGTATETNVSYASRLRQSWSSRHLGSSNSYRNYVLGEFPSTEDVLVQGYNDTLMKRDLVLTREGNNYYFRHAGGKVDLYVKGENYQTATQYIHIKGDKVRLTYPNLVSEDTIEITNITDPSNTLLTYNLTYEFPDTRTGYLDVQVVAGSGGSIPTAGDLIEIKYNGYTDSTLTSMLWCKDYLFYKSETSRLIYVPYSYVVSILEDLLGILPSQAGAADTEVILPSTFSSEDDFYNGLVIDITSSDGTVVSRAISDYTGSTHTAIVSTAYTTQPAENDTFIIKDLVISEDLDDGFYSLGYETPIIESSTAPSQAGLTNVQFKVDPSFAVAYEIFYKNNTLEITGGTGSGQNRNIDAYDIDTNICTVDEAWVTQPDNTSTYRIVTNEGDMSDTLFSSTSEKINFTIDDSATLGVSTLAFMENSILKLSYVYDKLMRDIQFDLDIEGHRIVTTDVLVRKAKPMYFYMVMKIMPKRGFSIGSYEKALLQEVLEEILSDIGFNSSLYASDIVGTLYKNTDVMEFMQYVQLPIGMQVYDEPQSFSEATLITMLETDVTFQNSYLSFTNDEYPVLAVLVIDDLS